MRLASILVLATCFVFVASFLGQNGNSTANPRQKKTGPIDLLSETNGFDMSSYLTRVVETVREKWFSHIPNVAQPRTSKKGYVSVKFRVIRDGHVQNAILDANSGDATLDQSAYGAITASNPLPPLPSGFACQYIDLGFNFYYNPTPGEVKEKNFKDQLTPCVTSKITSVKVLGLSISPNPVRVAVGTQQQFFDTLVEATDSGVTWSVEGAGCEGAACGVISANGLYTAPAKIPNPATISVRATTTTVPSDTASSIVTIVEAGDSH